MCRRHRKENESASEEALSPYDKHIDRFFHKVNDATNNISELTKKVVGQTYDAASSQDLSGWKERGDVFWRNLQQSEDKIDDYMNRPYQTRTRSQESPFRLPFDFFNVFGNSSSTPFGIYSYQSPSTSEYNECLSKRGVSLWDSEGYWRCLFPNSEVPADLINYKQRQLAGQILTKEDFEEAAHRVPVGKDGAIDLGSHGVFFKQFNDLLNWKNTMYENVRRQREASRQQIRESFSRNSSADRHDRHVVSTSVESSTNTDSDAKEVVKSERRTEVFSDGTTQSRSVIKRKPFGAKQWATVEETSDEGKNGWFWHSK